MGNHRPDKGPGQVGDHIVVIASRQGCDLQIHGEHHQQDHRHGKGGDIAHKQGHGQQHLVKALLDVGGQGTQHVAQDPAHEDGGQLQSDGPAHGGGNDLADPLGILAEGDAQIAAEQVLHINEELLGHGLVQTELLHVLLIGLLDDGRVGGAAHQLAGDGGHRVGRHQPGQDKVEENGEHKGDEKPDDLFAEILFVAFHGVDPLPFLSEVRL